MSAIIVIEHSRRDPLVSVRGALIGLLLCLFLAPSAYAAGPEVRIDSGALQGLELDNGTRAFLGIPYATAARWRPPAAVAAWNDPRAATDYGAYCPQILRDSYPQWISAHYASLPMAEDCLHLNVWAPQSGQKALPVLVYLHGGNMQFGAGSLPVYDGRELAAEGFVIVTLNYRVGFFGRFAHPSLTSTQAGEPLVNYGLMDQIAALEWVQRNIAAFGGDPEQVTLFGHSAGGVAVNFLMVSPPAKGLFQRAIAQGSGVLLDRTREAFKRGPAGAAGPSFEDVGVDLAEHFSIAGDHKAVASALRALSVTEILDYQGSFQISFNPVVDGVVVPEHIAVAFEKGLQQDIPYIGGANDWEHNQITVNVPLIGQWFMAGAFLEGMSDEDLAAFDDQWTRIGRSQRWFSEGLFLASTRYLAAQMDKVSSPAWQYRVTYVQENLRGEVPGAAHGMEVPFLFNRLREHPEYQRPQNVVLTERDFTWADTVRAYWLNFARGGNPNGPGLPEWPEYKPDTDQTQELGAEIVTRTGLNKQALDLLEARALARRRDWLAAQP